MQTKFTLFHPPSVQRGRHNEQETDASVGALIVLKF